MLEKVYWGPLKFFGIHLIFIFREIRGCYGVENGVVKVSMVFFYSNENKLKIGVFQVLKLEPWKFLDPMRIASLLFIYFFHFALVFLFKF